VFHRIRSFSTQLLLGLFMLILITTLSAGAPAFWLTRSELERQAWGRIDGAKQSTESLLQAQQKQLTDLLTLFAQRPTLQRLLVEEEFLALERYLNAFQMQSDLDLLILCDVSGEIRFTLAPTELCVKRPPSQFQLVDERPFLLVSRGIYHEESGTELGAAVMGIELNSGFLRQLAGDTGVQQSIILQDGRRIASSIADISLPESAHEHGKVQIGGHTYYAAAAPIEATEAPFYLEVALPVDEVISTERRSLFILIASTGLVALLGILLGTWYVRRLTLPLSRLTDVAEEISQGNWTTSIPHTSGPPEVATLTAALQRSQGSMLQALDDLAQARDWLDSLVQSIAEGVVTFDEQGRVTFLNQRAAALTSWSAQEAVGRDIDDLFVVSEDANTRFHNGAATRFRHQIPAPGDKKRITVMATTGRPARSLPQVGQQIRRRIGMPQEKTAKLTLEVTSTRIKPGGGAPAQTALVLRDVTQEEALQHLRSYFLANISHEFRTPLSTLNASIELLMDETLSADEMRNLLKPVQISLLGLETLINNLLESSSIEADRFVIHKRSVDLNAILANALQVVHPLMERRQQKISLRKPAETPSLDADAARLTQVLVNLLTNASKYSPIGEAIEVAVESMPGRVRIEVNDRGAGIPQAEQGNVFQRFVRLDAQSSDQVGMGLGLYVVKTTIERHGGEVGIENRAEGGATIWFELPVTTGEHGK
jgi:signal transduction histidine kinase